MPAGLGAGLLDQMRAVGLHRPHGDRVAVEWFKKDEARQARLEALEAAARPRPAGKRNQVPPAAAGVRRAA
ncbi:MAG: hypothetical protein J2P32_15125, partial [Actinobacteria bacterium]|nr:hypothetical protein [Actinomycetota bacterium]